MVEDSQAQTCNDRQTSLKKGCVVRFCEPCDPLCGKVGIVKDIVDGCAAVKVAGYEDQLMKLDDIEFVTCEFTMSDHLDLEFQDVMFDPMRKLIFDPQNLKFNIVPVDGKGLGVVATQGISKGERILEERPLVKCNAAGNKIVLPRNMPTEGAFWGLADVRTGHRGYPSVSNHPSGKTMRGILETNAFSLGDDSAYIGVFPLVSRFNHSCVSNIAHCWLQDLQCEVLHAVTDIQIGEELTISYCDAFTDRHTRQKMLFERYNFVCRCSACSLTGKKLLRSDTNRFRLQELHRANPASDPAEQLHLAEQALDMIDDEFLGRPGYKTLHYRRSAIASIALGDMRQARFMAFKDYEANCLDEGPDSQRSFNAWKRMADLMQSPAMIKFLAEQPSQYVENRASVKEKPETKEKEGNATSTDLRFSLEALD
eukprot:gnl/MRDRNA2_/MRDRNA2_70506_c0_seq1.p1 gnl/MRDRNA2_/MRDRNA2_70506_c0~~gnl/MRDRNA2_/MRDRNA2_70506_c0_seq1.p1  ORF type:complete len:426 (+),score=63.31 gnl/MRDRNA2_/MRDRNA2_70506_c0_seq1:216-1493(+)